MVSGQNKEIRILDGTSLRTIRSVDVKENVLSIAAYESGYAVLISLNNAVSIALYNSKLEFTTLLNSSVSEKCCIATRYSSSQIFVMDTDRRMKLYSKEGELKQSALISYQHSLYDYGHNKTEPVSICALNSGVLVSISDRNLVQKINFLPHGQENVVWECRAVKKPTRICSDAAGYIYVASSQDGISVLDGETGKLFLLQTHISTGLDTRQANVKDFSSHYSLLYIFSLGNKINSMHPQDWQHIKDISIQGDLLAVLFKSFRLKTFKILR